MNKQDKREFPRLSFSVFIGCEITGRIDTIIVTVPSKDINPGGIRVMLFDKFEEGTLLKLKFLIPGDEDFITATGQIVWINAVFGDNVNLKKTYDAGIKFIYIDSSDRKRITNYISKPS